MGAPALAHGHAEIDPVAALRDAWEDELRADRYESTPGPRDYVYASGRRSCVRAMALDLLHPEDRGVDSADALERMRRGKEREEAIVLRLQRAGRRSSVRFEVVEGQQRFEIRDRGVLVIAGKTDCRLKFETGAKPVAEVKSGETFKRVSHLEDLDRSPWTRHALDQLLSYLYANNEPWGLFVIDRPAMPLFLRVNLEDHLERTEAFLRDARTAVEARFARRELPTFTEDRANCRRCDHLGKSCAPPMSFGPGLQVITDPHLIELAELRDKHADGARIFGHADKELKGALRGVELGLLGDFSVQGRWQKSTKLDLPDAVKKLYQVVDPKGSFRVEIDRVTPAQEGGA